MRDDDHRSGCPLDEAHGDAPDDATVKAAETPRPDDKTVVLGLVTSKQPALEPVDALAARIDEAATYVDLDRLCLSPQCGFSSTVHGNLMTEDEQWAKLRLVVETAERVWG